MFRRWRRRSARDKCAPACGDLNEWVLSLPWVVERPSGYANVRLFGVDCKPLHRRRVWLITGLPDINSSDVKMTIAALIPAPPNLGAVMAGRDGHEWLPRDADHVLLTSLSLPGGHVIVTPKGPAGHERHALEAFVLRAYEYALS